MWIYKFNAHTEPWRPKRAQTLLRGLYSVEVPERPPGRSHLLELLQRATPWQRVGSNTDVGTARRAKERLRKFQH